MIIKRPGVYKTSMPNQVAVVLHIMSNPRPNNQYTAIGYYVDENEQQVPGRWNVKTGEASSNSGRGFNDHMYLRSLIYGF